ncbi:MAG: membrane protein insertion efficiency factor YidD [Bdellovibrionota bacterium]|nr:membrane protein insertion efficiency factor YidD [Bdellovibrionota bacterium]
MRWPFITMIKFYRLAISPLLGPRCRFQPSCSQYALEAFEKFSIPKAIYLTVKRISKCHPFHSGGHDPLP